MKDPVNFSVTQSQMDDTIRKAIRYSARARKVFRQIVEDTVFSLHRRAQDKVAIGKTRNLKHSIRIELDGLEGKVIAGGTGKVNYARHVEFGTKAHVILPKNAAFLSFFWPKMNAVVFLKKVNHPGTKAQPFMEPAAEAERPAYRKRVMREIIRARK